MTDFFISYTSADKEWAEWIAYVLEEERYSVIVQAWDFRPGTNFVLEMQKAAQKADRTVMVLSPDHMKSQFASPEWAAAFAKDPQGLMRKLVPVIVRPCEPDGLLGQIVHIDLSKFDQRKAREELLAGVRNDRAKPTSRPVFPGAALQTKSAFPGGGEADTPRKSAQPYMPKVKRIVSDIDKRRFLKAAFDTVRDYFAEALSALAGHTRGLEFDFQPVTAQEFTAEIFVNGKSIATCRIRYGDNMFSRDAIVYAEGQMSGNSANEILSLGDEGGEPVLSSLMGSVSFGPEKANIDTKRMTPDQAAEYLWRRFIYRLEA